MTTLKNIKGTQIKVLDSDPVEYLGTWASTPGVNTARKGLSGFGTATASIAATGNSPSTVTNCESWNGTAWSEVNDVNTGKFYRGNNGTSTAGLIIGGAPTTTDTEEWDGTNWTETANYPGSYYGIIQLGTQTSAFCIGGGDPYQTATNTYNGSTFTGSTAINTGRSNGIGSGLTTAAVIAGGTTPSATANTEVWNGSSWTEVNNLNTARDLLAGSGSSSTNSLAFGGLSTALASTESWNGTVWTEVNDMATGRRELGGSTNGSNQSALAFSGCTSPGTVQTASEEWSFPPSTSSNLIEGLMWFNNGLKGYVASIPTGTWSSGGSMNTGRQDQASFGSQDASLAVSGNYPATVNVENYNGTSWTEVANVTTGREFFSGGGTTDAGMVYSGTAPSVPQRTVNVEQWNGSGWTEIANVNTGRYGAGGTKTGTPTSQAMFCGNDGSNRGYTETWDGSSWSEVADANTARRLCAGVGSGSSDAFVFGGDTNPSPYTVNAETWNGSSWTEVGNLNTAARLMGSAGVTTSALCIGGDDPSADTAKNEFWNGTSWTELADLSAAKSNNSGSGSAAGGLSIGGAPALSITEEWTPSSVVSTITTS